MIIYKYDSGGFYTRTATLGDDDRDPLDTDNYLIPAGATTVSPPELQPNQAARLVDGEWSVLPDFAGVTYYLDDAEHVMSERGVALPAGATLEKPQAVINKELEIYKRVLLDKINAICNQRIDAGVMFAGKLFDSDTEAQLNVTGTAVQAQLIGANFSIDWIAYDNSIATLDARGIAGLGIAIGQHKTAKKIEANTYKMQILAAETTEQAQAALDAYQELEQAN